MDPIIQKAFLLRSRTYLRIYTSVRSNIGLRRGTLDRQYARINGIRRPAKSAYLKYIARYLQLQSVLLIPADRPGENKQWERKRSPL